MSAPIDEIRLAEIEMRANAILAEMTHARTRCDHCDAVDPPVDDRGRHDGCPDADEWPTKVGRDETRLEGVAGHCEIAGHMLTLVAEVRRLTAALATVTTERDGLRADMRKVLEAAEALADIGAARAAVERATTEAHRDDLRAALDAARREGAEGMRERCDDAITARLVEAVREVREKTYRGTGAEKDIATAVWEAIDAMRDTVRALPLGAPGGGS